MATHSSILAWKIMDGGDWRATVRGVTKSWTRLSNFTSLAIEEQQQRTILIVSKTRPS